MTLKECYEALGGDYEAVLGRLRAERLVQKYALRFLDEKSFEELEAGMQAKDGEMAFRAAHTIKGLCLNLGFDRLLASSSELCEKLRGGWTDDAIPLLDPVRQDYGQTIAALEAYKAEIGA